MCILNGVVDRSVGRSVSLSALGPACVCIEVVRVSNVDLDFFILLSTSIHLSVHSHSPFLCAFCTYHYHIQ